MNVPPRLTASLLLIVPLAFAGLGSGCTSNSPPTQVGRQARPSRTTLEAQLDAIFASHVTERASLSPDGLHLAFGVYERGQLRLNIVEVDSPDRKVDLLLGRDRLFGGDAPMTVMRPGLDFLGWADSSQLVYGLHDAGMETSRPPRIEVHVVQADGTNDRKLVDRSSFPRPAPNGQPGIAPGGLHMLGLAATGLPAVLVEVPGPTTAWTTYRIDLATGKKILLGTAAGLSGHLILDAMSRPRLAKVTDQSGLLPSGAKLPTYWYTDYPMPAGKARQNPITPEFRFDDNEVFAPHAIPLGFGKDPDLLYFASNVGRDTYGIYQLDLKTRQRTGFAIEEPDFDQADPRDQGTMNDDTLAENILVFDRQHEVVGVRTRGLRPGTRWLSESLARWQERLDAATPKQFVQILEWNDAQTRVLVRVFGPSDRGSFAVYEAGDPVRNLGFLPSAATPDDTNSPAKSFTVATEHGTALVGGMLVQPTHARATALVLVCPDFPEAHPDQHRDEPSPALQALAAMGYAAAEVSYRGTFGLGLAHLGAGRLEADRLAAEDAGDAARQLSAYLGLGSGQVALLGTGFGGYVALRAAELAPASFRAVVTVNAPSDPGKWLKSDFLPFIAARKATFLAAGRAAYPDLSTRAASIQAAVLILNESRSGGSAADVESAQAERLAAALRKAGRTVEYAQLGHEFSRGAPNEKTDAYLRIGRFLDAQFKRPGLVSIR